MPTTSIRFLLRLDYVNLDDKVATQIFGQLQRDFLQQDILSVAQLPDVPNTLQVDILPSVIPSIIHFIHEWWLVQSYVNLTIEHRVGDQEIIITVPFNTPPAQVMQYLALVRHQFEQSHD